MTQEESFEIYKRYELQEHQSLVAGYELPPLSKECEEALKILRYKVNPCLQFLTLSLEMYKELTIKMRNFPTYEKYALGSDIRNCILSLRGDLVESVCIPSLTIPSIKKVSAGLFKLKASLTLACACDYISTPQHFKLNKKVDELIMLLEKWVKVINKSKELKGKILV